VLLLMTDGHFSSYAELLEQTDWNRYGVVNGVAPRQPVRKLQLCIAATSPLQRWACKLSAATLGKRSSSISGQSRRLLDAAVKCSPIMVSAREMAISPASALSQP